MSRATLRVPSDLAAQIEELRERVRSSGGVPASKPQTALALLREIVAAKLAQKKQSHNSG